MKQKQNIDERKLHQTYRNTIGKAALVLAKHTLIGQAVTNNLEIIYHCCVKHCTLNYQTSRRLPESLKNFTPDLIIIADPTEICYATELLHDISWMQRFENIPVLFVCEELRVNANTTNDHIYYLQFPYEQDEFRTKLVSIFETELTQELPGTPLHSVNNLWIPASEFVKTPEKIHFLPDLS